MGLVFAIRSLKEVLVRLRNALSDVVVMVNVLMELAIALLHGLVKDATSNFALKIALVKELAKMEFVLAIHYFQDLIALLNYV